MKLIVLPGNSPLNKQWGEKVEAALRSHFSSIYVQQYSHWNKNPNIDFVVEIKKLIDHAKDKESYIVLAKSAGILLVLKAICEEGFKPKKCIFLGTPWSWALEKGEDMGPWLKGLTIPLLFIQEKEDPICSYNQLKQILTKLKLTDYPLKEIPGKDHAYLNIADFLDLILSFLKE